MSQPRAVERLTPRFDAPPATRLGMISLASDEVAPDELRAVICQPGFVLHESRIANSDTIDETTLRAMAAGLTEAAARLPGGAPYAAVAYLCTSASMLIGFEGVANRINTALPGAMVTNPMLAGIRACKRLGATRIALVTPYITEVTVGIANRFESSGISVSRMASFLTDSDARVARISENSLSDAAAEMSGGGGVDAVFLSCTALRTVHCIAEIEERVGCPVLGSNQVTAWDLLRMAGVGPTPGRWGRLFMATEKK